MNIFTNHKFTEIIKAIICKKTLPESVVDKIHNSMDENLEIKQNSCFIIFLYYNTEKQILEI